MMDFALDYEDEPEPEPEPLKPYDAVKWKGILSTFYCNACGMCLENEDDMIMHVLKHAPEAERETLMNELLKEKEIRHGKNIDHSTGS